MKKTRKVEYGPIYSGVNLSNIDPYKLLPDPGVPINEATTGEFIGWISDFTFGDLLAGEKEDNGLFNVRYLKKSSGYSILAYDNPTDRPSKLIEGGSSHVDVLWFFIDLIPSEWELGDSDYPERWLFGVAADKCIIQAKRLDFAHGEFPVAVIASDYDGHNTFPISKMESVNSLQHYIDFLYSSRILNIRKSLNDRIVVDPKLINVFDLQNSVPGGIIRMTKSQWGRGGIDQAVKQLDVLDVTQGNIGEMQLVEDMMQNFNGVPEQLQGQITNRGPRISATQAGGARSSSFSKLERHATIIDYQGMRPIGRHFASYVQQYLEEETYVKMTGEALTRYQKAYGNRNPAQGERVAVSPLDLLVNYDLRSSSKTVPGSQDPNTWIQLLQLAAGSNNPELFNTLDFSGIFLHIARQMGASNIDDFTRQAVPQVVADNQIDQQVQQGNIVPVT